MYTNQTILSSKQATVDTCIAISLTDISSLARHAWQAEQKKVMFELAYGNLTAVLHKVFSREIAKSGNVVQYENLDRMLNSGIVNLFSGIQYEYDHEKAVDRLTAQLQKEYTERIDTALLNGRNAVNIISRDRLLKMYHDHVDKAQSSTYQSDTLPISLEVVHDIFLFLLEGNISVMDIALPYEQYRDKYGSIFYQRETRRFKNSENVTVTDGGIFVTNSDGDIKCKYRFKSKHYTHIVDKYRWDVDNAFIPFSGNGVTINDTVTITDQWIYVDTSKSVYDVVYTMCNTFIERSRRSFTSNTKSFDVVDENGMHEIDLPYIEGKLDEIIATDTYIDLVDVLSDKLGMKYSTACDFVKCYMLVGDGYNKQTACQIVGLSKRTFYHLQKTYIPALVGDYSHLFV